MKYCINYYKNFRHIDKIDEIIFDCNKKFLDKSFIEFVKDNIKQEQRVILSMVNDAEVVTMMLPIVNKLKEVHENYAIRTDIASAVNFQLKDKGYKFFLVERCTDFDQVFSAIKYGSTDVYVTDQLGFNLMDVGTYAHEHNVKVRVLPNVAQSSIGILSQFPPENKFFIRPEDVDVYEPYVDVFELFGPEDKLSVTYEIYQEKEWRGPIGELIIGINELFSLDGKHPFGQYRLNCRQVCYKCELCNRFREINVITDKHNLKITERKDEQISE